MLCTDASTYLNPSERQVFDSLVAKAENARRDEQRTQLASAQAKSPPDRRKTRPFGDRMRVGED